MSLVVLAVYRKTTFFPLRYFPAPRILALQSLWTSGIKTPQSEREFHESLQ